MERIDTHGASLSLALFVKAYDGARKLAPSRFLQVRINPETFERLENLSEEVVKIVQIGSFTGHLGKQQTKIACAAAMNALGDGMLVNKDKECDVSRIEFQIHGVTELELANFT